MVHCIKHYIITQKIKFISILSLVLLANITSTQAADFIQFDEKNLVKVKLSLQNNTAHPLTVKAFESLINHADEKLHITPPTVIDKTISPPSKDKNDYLSISRYWWPDPTVKNGLPWIRKDGVTNPSTQTDDVDRNRLGLMTDSVKVLSLAYYFTDDEKYAAKAVTLIDTWFLDKKTRMNPHLSYAQSVPGNPKGRRSGILDGRLIPEKVLDAIIMLDGSESWTKKKNKKMNRWLSDYLDWLTDSKLGKSGAKQTNNHGSWYRFQVAALAWYLDEDELLNKAFNDAKRSFNKQFNAQGAQPHELERTRGFFYSCFNLTALTRVAAVVDKKGLSLWDYTNTKGRNLKNAVDYLLPVAQGKAWPHTSKNLDVSELLPVLNEIMTYQPAPEYEAALISVLSDLASDKDITKHQQYVLFNFALFNPQYLQ